MTVLITILILLTLALIFIRLNTKRVKFGQVLILVERGKVQVLRGPKSKLVFPWQSYLLLPTSTREFLFVVRELTTKDGFQVTMKVLITLSVKSSSDRLVNLIEVLSGLDDKEREEWIKDKVEEVVKEEVEDLLYQELTHEEMVKGKLREALEEEFNKYGLSVKNLELPELRNRIDFKT